MTTPIHGDTVNEGHRHGHGDLGMQISGPWTCALHKRHAPNPLRGCVHHIWPRGAGGPDVPENRITICETGHANVHTLMFALVSGDPLPSGSAPTELAFAQRGVAEWVAAGRPGDSRAFMA